MQTRPFMVMLYKAGLYAVPSENYLSWIKHNLKYVLFGPLTMFINISKCDCAHNILQWTISDMINEWMSVYRVANLQSLLVTTGICIQQFECDEIA